jgi:hypothetical protein
MVPRHVRAVTAFGVTERSRRRECSPADVVLLMVGTNDIVFNSDADFAYFGTRLSGALSEARMCTAG